MNKPTYRAVDAAHKTLTDLSMDPMADESLPMILKLESLREMAENAREDYENKSENWREGEAGQEENERVGQLEEAVVELDEAVSALERAAECLSDLMATAPEGSFNDR